MIVSKKKKEGEKRNRRGILQILTVKKCIIHVHLE